MSTQRLVPGVVGISTYVDCIYQREMQLAALDLLPSARPINRLRLATVTLDFEQFVLNLEAGHPERVEEQIAAAAQALAGAGADFLVVTSGTGSTLTSRAREGVSVPILELARATCDELAPLDLSAVGLLSTRQAANGRIFQNAAEGHGVAVLTPQESTAERVDDVIFHELICGEVTTAGTQVLDTAIDELVGDGAEAIILGNTDMSLAVDMLRDANPTPLIDSARTHARVAARVAIEGEHRLSS